MQANCGAWKGKTTTMATKISYSIKSLKILKYLELSLQMDRVDPQVDLTYLDPN